MPTGDQPRRGDRAGRVFNAMNGIARRCTPIENGQCGHGLRACLALTVRVAGRHRLLRIPVDLAKGAATS